MAKSNRRNGARNDGAARTAVKRSRIASPSPEAIKYPIAPDAPVDLSSRPPLPTGTVQLLSDVEEAEFEVTVRKQLQLMKGGRRTSLSYSSVDSGFRELSN